MAQCSSSRLLLPVEAAKPVCPTKYGFPLCERRGALSLKFAYSVHSASESTAATASSSPRVGHRLSNRIGKDWGNSNYLEVDKIFMLVRSYCRIEYPD